jgi:putative ABC transport system permease protein
MFLKWVWRELLRSWKFGLFFIFNLTLGLTGYLSLEAFKTSLEDTLHKNARAILSADLAVSARRELTETEKQKMTDILQGEEMSLSYDFFAMLTTSRGSRLVMVRAIDEKYPLYGSLGLASGQKVTSQTPKPLLGTETTWIYPELKAQLGLSVGGKVQLGALNLTVTDVIDKDETETFRAASIAPKIFIDRALIPKSGLIQFGSTYSVDYSFKLKDDTQTVEKKTKLLTALTDPAVSVETSQDAGESSGRQLGYLSDYLGLVAIIALFMSALGAAYLFRLFMTQRMREVAILRSLGLQATGAVSIYALQVCVLGLVSLIPTVIVSAGVLPLLSRLLATLTPFNLQPSITLRSVLLALVLGVIGSLTICLPFLLKIRQLQPARLFAEEKFSSDVEIRRPWVFIPGLLLFWVLAITQSNSLKIGSIFVAAFSAVLVVLFLAGFLILSLLKAFRSSKHWVVKYSLLGISRRLSSSLAVFIALGLGSLLINVLPQLKVSLQNEFKTDAISKVPSLFMFDIQDEQVDGIKAVLSEEKIESNGFSPMIRARILSVNDKPFERTLGSEGFKTREEESEARFRNRGVNLSYRDKNSESETIVAGEAFSGPFDATKQKLPFLSVEARYADRLGVKIGDRLRFDIQGIEVEAEVRNLRKVKWTSFQPNFFVLMQSGVLNEAPKTFVASVPKIPEIEKDRLQGILAKKFPNVSIVDIQRTVNDILRIADQMSWSLELMAALALFTGYVVLYSIISSQVRLRRWEINMLKVMGAKFQEVSRYLVLEFLVLSAGAAAIGAGVSIVVSYFISYYVFEGSFVLSWSWPVGTTLGVCLLSTLVAYLASRRVVGESPLVILQEER